MNIEKLISAAQEIERLHKLSRQRAETINKIAEMKIRGEIVESKTMKLYHSLEAVNYEDAILYLIDALHNEQNFEKEAE